jgi:FKBP-type peptidyl-prolyl cis-trans isomerase FkpA
MRSLLAALALLAASAPALSRAQALKTEDDKTLYALGLLAAKSFKELNLTAREFDIVKRGLTDAVGGKKPQIELAGYEPKIQAMVRARMEAQAKVHKETDKAYADKAAKEKGAEKTASGMVYIPVKEGAGPSPQATDKVKVHYAGKLTNGTEFDSSYKRNQPAEFPLNQVIRCWTEGLQKMKVGGKAKLVCPSDIAYGDQGRPPTIPGGATLVFDVELLEIVAKPAPAPQPAPGAK